MGVRDQDHLVEARERHNFMNDGSQDPETNGASWRVVTSLMTYSLNVSQYSRLLSDNCSLLLQFMQTIPKEDH